MVMDADGFFQLHDMFAWQPIRVSRVINPNWLPCKHIVELEETVIIHNHAKGVPDATMTSVAFQLASVPKEPQKKEITGLVVFVINEKKKVVPVPPLFCIVSLHPSFSLHSALCLFSPAFVLFAFYLGRFTSHV